MNEPLRQLLARCGQGENDAIAELVRRFQPWAVELAASLLADRDLAEDAVQEAFLTALRKLPDLHQAEAFPGWFRQIVRTQVYRIARKQRELPLAEEAEFTDGALTPEELAERSETARKVREALQSLPDAGRETAELFYLDDLSCAEISDVLRVPQGTVKRRLHDARSKLRSILLGYIGADAPQPEKRKPKDRGIPM